MLTYITIRAQTMKKTSDLVNEYYTFLEKTTSDQDRVLYLAIIKSIQNLSNPDILITNLSARVPLEKLIFCGFSRADIQKFTDATEEMYRNIYTAENISKKTYLARGLNFRYPVISNTGEQILFDARGMNLEPIYKALELIKSGYAGEKIRIGYDYENGIYLVDKPYMRYRVKGKRSQIVYFYMSKNTGFPESVSNQKHKQLVSKEINVINELFKNKLSLKNNLIVSKRSGYGLNSEVFKVI